MTSRWPVALTAVGMLAVAAVLVACAAGMGADGNSERDTVLNKIRATYNALEKADIKKRITVEKVKKDDTSGGPAGNEFDRCTDASKCKVGHPVDGNGTPVLDASKTIEDTVLFVSDVSSPGRTCVCYGNRCYCN